MTAANSRMPEPVPEPVHDRNGPGILGDRWVGPAEAEVEAEAEAPGIPGMGASGPRARSDVMPATSRAEVEAEAVMPMAHARGRAGGEECARPPVTGARCDGEDVRSGPDRAPEVHWGTAAVEEAVPRERQTSAHGPSARPAEA